MSIERISTDRLILRRLRESDLVDFNHYCSKDTVTQYMSWPAHTSLEVSRETLAMLIKTNVWAMVHREDKCMIGTISLEPGLRPYKKSRSLGYVMSDEYWGEGLMTEAARSLIEANFSQTDLDLIDAQVRPDNLASVRVIERLGFSYEGCLRAYSIDHEGRARDFNTYSLLRQEWLESRSR